jgi:flagellar motor protein MotB
MGVPYVSADDPALKFIFFGSPYCTVSRFSRDGVKVEQLPASEQAKIQDAASFVIRSFQNPTMTGGVVMAVGIRGHSDQDLQKTGKARREFETRISKERAEQVSASLIKAIKAKAFILDPHRIPAGDPLVPVVLGVGATMQVNTNPVTDSERSLNRRVDIFLLRDWESLARSSGFDIPAQRSFEDMA